MIAGMELFTQQMLTGLATGGIYALMALALVTIYQAIRHVNFAQGEMAMFSAFIAWQLLEWGVPYWPAFLLAILVSFAGGMAIQRVLFRPLRGAPAMTHIVVFIALFLIFNSLAGFIWDFSIKPFPSPFASPLFGKGVIGAHQSGMLVVILVVLVLLFVFLRFTRLGLALRAAAADPESAQLAGVRVGRMAALGWGLASAIGAVAGIMIAPIVFLEPNMMVSVLIYGFAGAVLGGLKSPTGAVAGGFVVGIVENLAATYIPTVGPELKLPIALLMIIAVLVARPSGMFARRTAQRV
jgi:branched-chain amino acid transport system permease protein